MEVLSKNKSVFFNSFKKQVNIFSFFFAFIDFSNCLLVMFIILQIEHAEAVMIF